MAYPQLASRHTSSASVEEISRESAHYRLSIPSGSANSYRLAQLDDYARLSRGRFPHHTPISLRLSARTSSDAIPGTWGFGLWNDPFGLSLGLGGNPFRLPALPNAVWFFGASKESYLSFKGQSRAERRSRTEVEAQLINRPSTSTSSPLRQAQGRSVSAQGEVANGFIAQTFRAPRFHPLLIPAGLALPFSRKTTRRLLSRVIEEDGIQLWGQGAHSRHVNNKQEMQVQAPALQRVDPTDWHRYRLDWSPKRISFEVDDVQVFESAVSPNPPLGLVIWIDNQYASFTPKGKIGFGVLENPEPAWLEVKEIELM